MLTISENEGIDLSEMKQIGLILGNLALDGISAREFLVKAILESDYIEKVVLNVFSSFQPEKFDSLECILWAFENLLEEQSKKSYNTLAKKVYPLLMFLN